MRKGWKERLLRRAAWRRLSVTSALVCLAVFGYIAFFGWLSIRRHEAFQSNAMDLGYTDQAVWNTIHGRFMRFSTYQDAPIDLSLDRFRRIDTLLAYHVELLLAPISLLYLVYDSPRALLLLQTVVLGLGALPAFWLARDHLKSGFAGLVFALAYLLAPALEGANLSDFHAVSLTASLLLFAYYFLRARRYRPFFAVALVAMSAKEDVSLLVLMLGLYALLWLKERRVGAITAAVGLGWFLICTQVIVPHYSGLPISPFLYRVAIFGPTAEDSLSNVLRDPRLVVHWVLQPGIIMYARGLLASAGYMPLFSPATLIIAAPIAAMNVFSAWDWTYSEGAHYSASIMPFIIISGIYGLGFVVDLCSSRHEAVRPYVVTGLAGLVLLISGYHHYRVGVSPLASGFEPPRLSPHTQVGHELASLVPPSAALSVQSALYPHLAHREKAYLFPVINDAEYVFLDVTSASYPLGMVAVRSELEQLLNSGDFGIVAAVDGYLLLGRGLAQSTDSGLPPSFYTFARVDAAEVTHPVQALFGDKLELLGCDASIRPVVNALFHQVVVTTYWLARRPLDEPYVFAFFFSRRDGAITGQYDGLTATGLWYPTHLWNEGEMIRVDTPVLTVGRQQDALLAVVYPLADSSSVEGRLRPIRSADDQPLEAFQDDSLLRLLRLP